jgi:subtilisin family serine protease
MWNLDKNGAAGVAARILLTCAVALAAAVPAAARPVDRNDNGPTNDRPRDGATIQRAPIVEPPDYTIALKNRVIEADCSIDADFLDAIKNGTSPAVHGIVQLNSLPHAVAPGTNAVDDVQTLAGLGVQLLSYLNGRDGTGTAYLASISKDVQSDDPRFAELVRCLVPLETDDKLETSLIADSTPARLAVSEVFVRFFDDVNAEDQRALFAQMQLDASPYADGLWTVPADVDQIAELAMADAVQWVQPGPVPFLPTLSDVRSLEHVDEVQQLDTATGVYSGLAGDGVQVGIMDTGVDNEHDDFMGRIIRSLDNGVDHGSHVAGIVAGSGVRSNQSNDAAVPNGGTAFQWHGMAPHAGIAAYGQAGGNASVYQDAIVNYGVDVSNHSYVLQVQNQYDADVQSVDRIVRGDSAGVPARPIVWAAANNASVGPRDCDGDGINDGNWPQYPNGCPTAFKAGYFSILSPCKNCIDVGAMDKASVHAGFSSMGPTSDGRLKPDVTAVGVGVTSVGADSDSNGNPIPGNGYRGKSGTSMAAPAVTGIVALMLEQYAATQAVNIDTNPPLPSTMKAILVQSADDLTGVDPTINYDTGAAVSYGAGPDWATGYGLVNAQQAVRIVSGGNPAAFLEDAVSPGNPTDNWGVTVGAGQREVRVTLAWDDVAGTPNSNDGARQLVNDLDLVVVDALGGEHLPLVLPAVTPLDCDGNALNGIQVGTCSGPDNGAQNFFGPAAPGIDRRNNVEQVVVTSASPLPAGAWTARVSVLEPDGTTVRMPMGGTQSYSLVTKVPNRAPTAICQLDVEIADGSCCADVSAGDVDGGSFDPNGDADIVSRCITRADGAPVACVPSVQVCGAGSHTVELTVTDAAGEKSSCLASVQLNDTTPPAITCPSDVILECPSNTDPSATGTATATDNCSTPTIGHGDVVTPNCGGTETIARTWSATDASGNVATCDQTVKTIDTTPPDVASSVQTDSLWPPNQKFVDVGFAYTATDACDPNPPAIAIAVTSDEDPEYELGAAGPKHCPDALVQGSSVLLRSERAGTGDGRVYGVHVTATDACGNAAAAASAVTVAKAQGGPNSTPVDSGQTYDAQVCSDAGPAHVHRP